jgi:hypothetical protein
MNKEKSIKK